MKITKRQLRRIIREAMEEVSMYDLGREDSLAGARPQLPDGDYTVSVNALDASGNLMPVTYTIFGRVTGAGVDEGQSNLFMGDKISIPHDKIKSVKETKVTAP